MRAGGPASESLKGRKPRDGDRPAPRRRYGDLGLGGAAREGRGSASVDDARASDGPRDRPIGIGERLGGKEARDVGRRDRLGRERSGAGGGPRRAEVGGGAGRSGGHEELIPADSAVKLRGRAPRSNVSMMRMRPPQQGQILACLRRGGFGGGRGGACIGFGARPSGRVGGRDQVPQAPDGCSASGAGEEAVVADAVEAAGQHVQEEAAGELAGRRASWS